MFSMPYIPLRSNTFCSSRAGTLCGQSHFIAGRSRRPAPHRRQFRWGGGPKSRRQLRQPASWQRQLPLARRRRLLPHPPHCRVLHLRCRHPAGPSPKLTHGRIDCDPGTFGAGVCGCKLRMSASSYTHAERGHGGAHRKFSVCPGKSQQVHTALRNLVKLGGSASVGENGRSSRCTRVDPHIRRRPPPPPTPDSTACPLTPMQLSRCRRELRRWRWQFHPLPPTLLHSWHQLALPLQHAETRML